MMRITVLLIICMALIGNGMGGQSRECGVFECDDDPPHVDNGDFVVRSGRTRADLVCHPGYDLVGEETIRCRANLQWASTDSLCQGLSGTRFLTVFPRTVIQDNADVEVRRLIIASNGAATVNVTNVSAGTTLTINVVNFAEVHFPIGLTQTEDNVTNNKVLEISAEPPVSVHVLVSSIKNLQAQDSFLVRPTPKLCSEYIVMTTERTPQFNVIALHDDTMVTLALTNGINQDVVLNQNMVFTRFFDSGDLTGSKITANKDVALISGGYFGMVPPSGAFFDMSSDQLICPDDWKTTCIMGPYKPRNGFIYKVVARDDGTVVSLSVNGVSTTQNLDRCEKHEEFVMPDSERTVVVDSNKPVLVAQFSLNNVPGSMINNADSSMVLCVPPEEYLSVYRFYTPGPNRDSFIRITIKSEFDGDILLNGMPFVPSDMISVTGPGGVPYTILYAELITDTYYVLRTASGEPFNAELYGINGQGHAQYTTSLGRRMD